MWKMTRNTYMCYTVYTTFVSFLSLKVTHKLLNHAIHNFWGVSSKCLHDQSESQSWQDRERGVIFDAAFNRTGLYDFQLSTERDYKIFPRLFVSCPEQHNRWPCHSPRATLETCNLSDIWSKWWGSITWPTFWQLVFEILIIFDNSDNIWQL